MKCRCGCDEEAEYLVSGFDFDPRETGGKGKPFVDEPCCYNAWRYLLESGDVLSLPTNSRKIGATMENTKKPEECPWIYDPWVYDGTPAWVTECGNLHYLADGTPTDNLYKFCPYCGKVICAEMEVAP